MEPEKQSLRVWLNRLRWNLDKWIAVILVGGMLLMLTPAIETAVFKHDPAWITQAVQFAVNSVTKLWDKLF